jgi:hypothetical protein
MSGGLCLAYLDFGLWLVLMIVLAAAMMIGSLISYQRHEGWRYCNSWL